MKKQIIVVSALALAGIAFVLFFPRDNSEENQLAERGLQIREIDDPEGPTNQTVVMAPEAIPESMKERLIAPSIALLPNRTGYPEMKGEAAMPPGEAKKIKVLAENFLRSWETYSPGDPAYNKKLKPFLSIDSAASERVDSTDPGSVCPFAGCTLGSRWHEGKNFNNSAFIIDWQGPLLYFVAYGAVRYISAEGVSRGSATRSYGILMRKAEDNWKIERVAAENLQ